MYNRVLTKKDLEDSKNYISDKNYRSDYPHYLWDQEDAILKWTSILKSIYSLNYSGLKIIDLGCGDCKVTQILKDSGNLIIGIDSDERANALKDIIEVIIGDALEILSKIEENTIDVVYDSCSVTHFYMDQEGEIPNIGWDKVSKEVQRILKPKGVFIISTDCRIEDSVGEFISPKQIIEIIEKNKLRLSSNFDDNDKDYYNYYDGSLYVSTLSFVK